MSLARNTFVQASFTALSRLFGFARDRVLSNLMGASWIGDAFVMAQTFPNLFRRILAEGAFSQAFVPLYAKATKERGTDGAALLASEAFSVLTLAALLLTIIAQIFMPWIIYVFHNGQADDPKAFQLAVLLTQITMPYLVGMAASSLFAGVLNTASKFALSAFAPTLLNITILAAVIFTKDPEQTAINGAIAISLAGLFQALLLFYGCRRLGIKIGLKMPKLTPDVKNILKIMGPSIIAGSATQINVMVSQPLQSFEVGAKMWLYSADRLYQLPLGLIGVAIGVALLPRLSAALADKENQDDDKKALDEGFVLSMALTLPAAAALLTIPYFLMFGFWAGGNFTAQDAQNTANALVQYAWGVPAFVLIRIFAPPFFARSDTKSPMNYALIGVFANVIIGAGLFYIFHKHNNMGYIGLAIGTSVAAWINAGLLIFALLKRGWWRITPETMSKLSKIIGATFCMGAYLYAAQYFQDTIISWFSFIPLAEKEVAILMVSLLGMLIYLIAAFALGAIRKSDIKAIMKK